MTQQPNVRLVLPNPNDATDPANLQAIALWAVNYVVNQIVAGLGIALKTQAQAIGPGAAGTGIVEIINEGILGLIAGTNITITEVEPGVLEISASGGGGTFYASLTGTGETTTPGNLTQNGDLVVNNDFFAAGAVSVAVPPANSGGISLVDHGSGGISINDLGAAGVTVEAQAGPLNLESTLDYVLVIAGGPGFHLYTASNLAGLPASPAAVAWGFTQDGHIYFYPVGGPWTLKV